jgi:tripartite-type tricarboxylate transporter receptor subunit TctC
MVLRASLLLAAAIVTAPLAALADSESNFFKAKNITVIVPAGPGGSYHLYAQIVQRYLGSHIPGNPSLIVQNKPGAGGAASAAYMMNVAPKNGTVIAELVPGMITDPIVKSSVSYDARKFNFLGSIAARDFSIAVWGDVPVKTLDDLRKQEITIGTTGRASAGYVVPHFINSVLGTKMKVITGYASGGDVDIAMERKEVQGRGNYYSGFASVRPDWIRNHMIRFILTMGPANPALKGVPRVRDFLKPGSLEEKTFNLLEMNFNVGQSFYAPPGVSPARIATLRKAFAAMLDDKAMQADLAKHNLDFGPQGPAQIDREINQGFNGATPEVIKRFRVMMGGQKAKS